MYRASFNDLGATKQRIAVTAARPKPGRYGTKTTWVPFYDGSVLTSRPMERTVRFVMDYVSKNFEHVPQQADARFDAKGDMVFIEVFSPFSEGKVAAVKQPHTKISVPVDVRYGGDTVRRINFRTKNLSEKSIVLLHAWIASRQHWSGTKYKYAFWKPKKTTARFSAATGRPEKIVVQVGKGTTGTAGAAKITLDQIYASL